ncbi:baseplate J/gp47 family protein [Streptomyces sp. FXJ1.172]|uniref:baseplate J/gp47 family protein n=1 Tax=Streptomyces sp. FXJ1.172 TaxID=710705 RepID=UPI000831AC72|nr:baseplate J/gp47 family protein [Streptomyces sp. FXJ1.172]WEO99769.1 baseplate J/gp47 family protein [Streptomyces sp. FXJ1.172]
MTDFDTFGVGPDGFVLKGLDRIIADQQARARDMFGDDVDLTSGSALRKVLDAVAVHAHELWRGLEAQYYANFVTTAQGPSLDLLGTDLGIGRRWLPAGGRVALTLSDAAPGRRYVLPEGTLVESLTQQPVSLRTTETVSLSAVTPSAVVGVQAVDPEWAGQIQAGEQLRLDPDWAGLHLSLGTATVKPAAAAEFHGHSLLESDADYRARLLGVPRTLWTKESVLDRILDVTGVRDAAVFDPLGGVDASQRYFNTFLFGQRAFSAQRRIGSPYYFDVVVATEPGWPWTTGGGTVQGAQDAVIDIVRQWRPVSVFANVVQANQVDVAIRATFVVEPGHDTDAIQGEILAAVHASVNNLRLGSGVRYSDIMLIARTTTGVVDVQNLHLRRYPPAFDDINFSGGVFGRSEELEVGENLVMAPTEIAQFTIDSPLIDIQVVTER